ncbi:MAG: hypothetical protein AB7O73_03050, partial [Bacteroidia bacterium]
GTGIWTKPTATSVALTNSGDKVGIGTNFPFYPLDVSNPGNNFIRSRSTSNGYTGFLIDRPNTTVPGYIIYDDAGNTLWTVGTHTFTQNYSIYNWPFDRFDLSVNYNSGYVGIGTTTPSTNLHVMGKATIQDGSQGDGRVLLSDGNGTGTWTNTPAPATFTSLNVSSVTVPNLPTPLGIPGISYNKIYANTKLVIHFQSRVFSGLFSGGVTDLSYEIRVNGNPTLHGGVYVTSNQNSNEYVFITAIFMGIPAGFQNISIVGYTNAGTASGVVVDPGGLKGKITVKEEF